MLSCVASGRNTVSTMSTVSWSSKPSSAARSLISGLARSIAGRTAGTAIPRATAARPDCSSARWSLSRAGGEGDRRPLSAVSVLANLPSGRMEVWPSGRPSFNTLPVAPSDPASSALTHLLLGERGLRSRARIQTAAACAPLMSRSVWVLSDPPRPAPGRILCLPPGHLQRSCQKSTMCTFKERSVDPNR